MCENLRQEAPIFGWGASLLNLTKLPGINFWTMKLSALSLKNWVFAAHLPGDKFTPAKAGAGMTRSGTRKLIDRIGIICLEYAL